LHLVLCTSVCVRVLENKGENEMAIKICIGSYAIYTAVLYTSVTYPICPVHTG
jgi:hypothetical protein